MSDIPLSRIDPADLRAGWEGFVILTACKKPWLAMLTKSGGGLTLSAKGRGMTKAEAITAALIDADARAEKRRGLH